MPLKHYLGNSQNTNPLPGTKGSQTRREDSTGWGPKEGATQIGERIGISGEVGPLKL